MSRATSHAQALALYLVLVPGLARADDRPGASVASVTSRVQGLPLAEWREELDLTADQVRALQEVDAWFVAERDALVARGRGQGGHGLAQRYRGLRGELERRLGAEEPGEVPGGALVALSGFEPDPERSCDPGDVDPR